MPYKELTPSLHDSVFVANGSQIIGDVRIGANSSIWFNTVLRGDVNYIQIGEYTNIQDNSTLHVVNHQACIVGDYVTAGHGVIIHACTINDYCLIGMGAILLNQAEIGEYCIIAAGTLIPERKVIPPYSLVMGSPGKIVRQLNEVEIRNLKESALHYSQLADNY